MRFGFQCTNAKELTQAMELLPLLGENAFIELLVGERPFEDTDLCAAMEKFNPPIAVVGIQPAKDFAAAVSLSLEDQKGRIRLIDAALFASLSGAKKLVFCPAVYEVRPQYFNPLVREEEILRRARELKTGFISLQAQCALEFALEHDLRPPRFSDEPKAEDIFATSRIYTVRDLFCSDIKGVGICLDSARALGVNNTRNAFAIASKHLAHIRLSDFDVFDDPLQDPQDDAFLTGIFPGRGFHKETWPLTDLLCFAQRSYPNMTITLECRDRSLMEETAKWIGEQRQWFEKA